MIKMIEYVNSVLLLTFLGNICYIYYKYKAFFHAINIVMNNTRLIKQPRKEVDSEVTKSKRGRKKKTLPTINEVEENGIRNKRERLVACVLSGNSKQYIGKEYTEN